MSCALVTGAVFDNDDDQGRGYLNYPQIDSGIKAIRARATDANGAVAEASIAVYVITLLDGPGETGMGEFRPCRLNVDMA